MIEFMKDSPLITLFGLYIICSTIEVVMKAICRACSEKYSSAWVEVEKAKLERAKIVKED